jgi:hypothetical protein
MVSWLPTNYMSSDMVRMYGSNLVITYITVYVFI